MIIKNIKTLYNFFAKRKFSTIASLLLFSITASIDNIIIFLGEYEFRQILENSKITNISEIILFIIFIRFAFQIAIIIYNKMQFGTIFLNSLKKFLSSLPQNKEIFGQNHMLNNILKFEWEMNFISSEINYFYTKIISNTAYFIIAIVSSCRILYLYPNGYYTMSFTLSIFFLVLICIMYAIQSKIELNNFKSTENSLSSINNDTISFIEKENVKNNNEKYKTFINEKLKIIKSIFTNVFSKKSFVEVLIVGTKMTGLISIFYVSLNAFEENQDLALISFIIYNLFIIYFGIRLYKNIQDKNSLALIAQHNTSIARKDEYETDEQIVASTSRNEIIVENIEFRDVMLQLNELQMNHINFFAKIRDNIAFLSSQNNISLIRMFFEKNEVKKSGETFINNYELGRFNAKNLSEIIVTISNDINIYNDTVKNNLIMENSQASDDIIIKACKLSHLYNFITSLPLGFYTILNNSITLTEIEKFQISLTRALLGDAHIIIVDFTQLDEDNPIIHSIKEILLSSLVDRILIMITKNTFGMKDMTQIILYDKENIITHGSHDELIKNSKKYGDFYLKNYNNIEFNE